MNLLKTELGKRIEEESAGISRTTGVTKLFFQTLDELFTRNGDGDEKEQMTMGYSRGNPLSTSYVHLIAQSLKDEVLEVILKVGIQCIAERRAYSNDMLHIAYWYEVEKKKTKPMDTMLFGTIKRTVMEILADTTNKRDWQWMSSFLLSAPMWYEKMDPLDAKSGILWDLLFEWVEEETKRQSVKLSEPMRAIESEDEKQWQRLIAYDIESRFPVARQDAIPRGLKAEYTKDDLIQRVSLSASFNPLQHHDLQQYLTKLVLLSHECDDQFQRDIQSIFSVDPETMENEKLKLQYMRGPVKRLERCYAKCQSDYRDERFPTASHVLDIIRCTLIFEDVSSMLEGMDLFQDRIKGDEFAIKEVVRVKNGFVEYTHDTATYTDIKFNVMVSVDGKGNSIITEVCTLSLFVFMC